MDRTREIRTLGILSILAGLAVMTVVLPFWAPLLWAIVVSVVFRPVYLRLARHVSPYLASGLTLIVILIVLIVPATLVGLVVTNEVVAASRTAGVSDQASVAARLDQFILNLPDWARNALSRYDISNAADIVARGWQQVQSNVEEIISSVFSVGQTVASTALSILMMLYLCFFFLVTGPELVRRGSALLPLGDAARTTLIDRIGTVMRATVKGGILVAIMQGTIGAIVFAVLGLPSPYLWGAVMGFAALLPAIGTGLVWVPASIFLLITGNTWQGIALALAGVFIISSSDNVVRPMIVGKDTGIPDWAILVTTLGGVSVFGFHGLVFGPLLAGMALAVWELYARSKGVTPLFAEVAPDSASAEEN